MVPRWRIFGDFLRSLFSAIRVQDILDLHSKFALKSHRVCGSMVDIRFATDEKRRGKKRRRKKEERKKKVTTAAK